MPNLKTDFFTVAQSGPTVDGREIKKQWLKDAAETYNQALHLSKIWPEHMRWMPMGEIAEVRYTEDAASGIGYLENRISPNDDLLYYVRQGRMNQPSIEIIEDFAGTNKAYLYGLGATSTPASLGVGKIPVLFNAQDAEGKRTLELYAHRIALDANAPSEKVHIFASPTAWEDLEFKKQKSIFDLGRFFSSREEPTPPEDDLDMKPEELKQLLGEFKTELKQELKQEFATPPPAEPEVQPEPEAPEETPETVSAEEFNNLKTDFSELAKKFDQFMNEEEPQPKPPEHGTTDADDVWNWK